jgi:hypothetical protein
VERVLPYVADPLRAWGIPNEHRADADMPKAKNDPAHSGTIVAELIDVGDAWDWGLQGGLTALEQQDTFLYFMDGMTQREIAGNRGVNQSLVSRRIEVAIGKLTARVNREKYVAGYGHDDNDNYTQETNQ